MSDPIPTNQTIVEEILKGTQREGVDKLIEFLSSSDFYTAPCSTRFHLAKQGGLVEHTLNVLRCAVELNRKYGSPCTEVSVSIAAIAHDFCKINFYIEDLESPTDAQITYLRGLCSKANIRVPDKLNKAYASTCIDHLKSMKKLPLPEFVPGYAVKDQFPMGHGEKSAFVIQQFIALTVEEALAIRWHMASFDAGIHFQYPSGFAYNEALKVSKLVSIIIIADMEASNLMEV
jgi:hypothetical protein